MQKLLLFLLFFFSLEASNPNVYSALGDNIYNNIDSIRSLKKLDSYKELSDKIDTYIKDVAKAKAFGFEVQRGARSNLKLDYLSELRKLTKINNYFLRTANSSFKSSIKTKNNDLFIAIVNSSLINVKTNKKQIMDYYNGHKDEINAEGVIQGYLDEAYAKKHKKRYKPKTKKQLHEEKNQEAAFK
ncbi:MAG: hypothetical protein Q9M43_09190 [Sulfurimonas sp.]|nr:hypothetical protein [Sulfurimonas sp.]